MPEDQKKETIGRMEELIKISDSLKQEHTLSSAWEERNSPQKDVKILTPSHKNNNHEIKKEEEEEEGESSEEYEEPEENREINTPRSSSDIYNDIKQVHMLMSALKDSMEICKPSEWSNNIMGIFSKRFSDLSLELRNVEKSYGIDEEVKPNITIPKESEPYIYSSTPQSCPAKNEGSPNFDPLNRYKNASSKKKSNIVQDEIPPRPHSEPVIDDYENEENDSDIDETDFLNEIMVLQTQFQQLQQDLALAKTNEERQNILYRLMELEKKFKKVNNKMNNVSDKIKDNSKKPRSAIDINKDIQTCYDEFVKLKNELPSADTKRKEEIIVRMTEIKTNIETLSKELEEIEGSFPTPTIKPKELSQKQNYNQPLDKQTIIDRMLEIKSKFNEYKKRLETASEEESKEILKNIDELLAESKQIESIMISMSNKVQNDRQQRRESAVGI